MARPQEPLTTVFCTTIIGPYDTPPTLEVVDETARYICYTDQPLPPSPPWEFVTIDRYFTDDKITNGFLKSLTHQHAGGNAVHIWVDANLKDVRLDGQTARGLLDGRSVAVLPHLERSTVEAEVHAVVECRVEHPERAERVWQHLLEQGFTDGVGLSATMLLVRRTDDPWVAEFERQWWHCIAKLSRRDQLSFDYCLWHNGLRPSCIPADWREPNQYFTRTDHLPGATSTRFVESSPSTELSHLAMPGLPAEYPDVRLWPTESWQPETLAAIKQINSTVQDSQERLEGNYCYFDGAAIATLTPPDPRRSHKREYLRRAGAGATAVLEVGFNAGHSSAILLGDCGCRSLTTVDLGEHSYSQPCSSLLEAAFPLRIESHWGPSSDVLPTLTAESVRRFDLIHIDGGHGDDVFAFDLGWFLANARLGCRLLVDDCYVPYISERLAAAVEQGYLQEVGLELESSGENRLYSLVIRPATPA